MHRSFVIRAYVFYTIRASSFVVGPMRVGDDATPESGRGFVLRVSAGVDLARPENGTLKPNGTVVRPVGVDQNTSQRAGEPPVDPSCSGPVNGSL
jgi:hypothetical protein